MRFTSLALLMIVGCQSGAAPSGDPSSSPLVTADLVINGYAENAAAADSRYQGKPLRLLATVAQIGSHETYSYKFSNAGDAPNLVCVWSDLPGLRKLRPGLKVLIFGVCVGHEPNILADPQVQVRFTGCRLLKILSDQEADALRATVRP